MLICQVLTANPSWKRMKTVRDCRERPHIVWNTDEKPWEFFQVYTMDKTKEIIQSYQRLMRKTDWSSLSLQDILEYKFTFVYQKNTYLTEIFDDVVVRIFDAVVDESAYFLLWISYVLHFPAHFALRNVNKSVLICCVFPPFFWPRSTPVRPVAVPAWVKQALLTHQPV